MNNTYINTKKEWVIEALETLLLNNKPVTLKEIKKYLINKYNVIDNWSSMYLYNFAKKGIVKRMKIANVYHYWLPKNENISTFKIPKSI